MLRLPSGPLQDILSFLDFKDLIQVSKTCKKFRTCCSQQKSRFSDPVYQRAYKNIQSGLRWLPELTSPLFELYSDLLVPTNKIYQQGKFGAVVISPDSSSLHKVINLFFKSLNYGPERDLWNSWTYSNGLSMTRTEDFYGSFETHYATHFQFDPETIRNFKQGRNNYLAELRKTFLAPCNVPRLNIIFLDRRNDFLIRYFDFLPVYYVHGVKRWPRHMKN